MLIRKAVSADAQAVFELRNAAINAQCAAHYAAADLKIWTSGEMSDSLIRHVETICHVAVIEGTVAGTCMLDLVSGQVDAIFVHPAFMRRGIGRQMMQHLQSLAQEAGLASLHLSATLNAVAFYRSLGFTGDTIAQYKSPRGISLDCVPMVKPIRLTAEAK